MSFEKPMTFLTIGNSNLNMQIQTIIFPTLSGGLCWPVVLVVPLRQIWRECPCSPWSDGITLHPRLRCVNVFPSDLLDEGTSLVPQQITNLFEGHISCNLVRGKILMRCQVFSLELAACHLLHNKSCQSFNKIPLPMTLIQGGGMVIFLHRIYQSSNKIPFPMTFMSPWKDSYNENL